jgi:hypothetical protein
MDMASMVIEGGEYLSARDASEELGLSLESVKKAVSRGTLTPSRKMGNYNLFPREEIERYRVESLGRAGRKKTEKLSSRR